jgi:hypothetical protein
MPMPHPTIRRTGSAILLLAVLTLAAGEEVRAQGPATSFDQLSVLVDRGDKVRVTPSSGKPFSGRIVGLSASELTLRVGDELRRLKEADVSAIRHRRQDSLRNGALWGLGAGATAGMVACGRCHIGPGLAVAALYGGLGAGIGVGIDALIEGKVTVFEGLGKSRVVLRPQLTPSHKGATVSVQW